MMDKSQLQSVHDFATTVALAVEAIRTTTELEDRAARARQTEQEAKDRRAMHEERAARVEADADAHVADRMRALDEKVKQTELTLAELKKKHDALMATSKTQIDGIDMTRSRINADVVSLRQERDRLQSEVAALHARVTEIAASI